MGLENVRALNERMCQVHEPDDIESEFEVECERDNSHPVSLGNDDDEFDRKVEKNDDESPHMGV